jgi:hypothetical protein
VGSGAGGAAVAGADAVGAVVSVLDAEGVPASCQAVTFSDVIDIVISFSPAK